MLVRRTLWHGLYTGVGYAPRVISGRAHFISAQSFVPPAVVYQEYFLRGSWDTTHGVVAEGGIERRAGPLRIVPEIRYILWNQPALNIQQPHGQFAVSPEDPVDVLAGITFGGPRLRL
jgi:hypothetical protein